MPRSSRHKSHKQSKHSSKDYSDSEEDVKIKEKSSKDDNPVRVHRDSASGEKRKITSQVREGKEAKDLSGHGNGEVSEYVSSKRRKERGDASVGGDRWNGCSEERGDTDRSVDKDIIKGESSKLEFKLKDSGNKGDSLRTESKNKSKRCESVSASERKEDGLASVVVDKEESKSKAESKRKSERDSSTRKEGRESKDKDRRLEKEKNGVQEHKRADADVKFVEVDVGKKQELLARDLVEERQSKRTRENTERSGHDELRIPELEKEKDTEKKMCRRREGSSERDKHYDDSIVGDERRMSSRAERSKDTKYKDDRQNDGIYSDKYQDDSRRDERQRDEKYREEADKDNKHRDDKYREDGEKDSRRRDDRHRDDGDRDKRKDDKHREDGERDSRRKDEKYREGTERGGRRKDDRYFEKHREDNDKYRHSDDKYQEEGARDDRRKDNSYREDGDKDSSHKEEKYQDSERDIHYKENKQGDDFDREKRQRDTKYRDERTSRDHSGDKSDLKRPRDDGYGADHYSIKSSGYDSPTHDDRSARYRDEQGRRRPNEKEDYADARSRGTKDQRSDIEKRSAGSTRLESVADKGRSSSRNADIDLTSGYSRSRSSPTASSHLPRDKYRVPKQDDSKYRDYNYEERFRSRDYGASVGGSEKTPSSRSLEKPSQKDDGHSGELLADRRLKSDIRASPLHIVDKSPSSSNDKRRFSRSDVRHSIDVEESLQRSGSSRDVKEYSVKEGNVLQGDDFTQLDADTSSVSSPPIRNNHFSGSNKSLLPPPPFRLGVDSPSSLGPEEESRGRANSRHRRIGDPNMGRMPGNVWRGIPSWPSSVANGYLPFPHAPPPVSFPSVMQPFPAPPMFGVRPPMEFTHTASYHMPDADRFAGPGRPMGWRNQVDTWEGNPVFGNDSHMYVRPEWDHSRNMSGGRGWDPSGDLWKGPSRNVSLEMPPEKENHPTQSMDEALDKLSTQPAQSEPTRTEQQAQSSEISQSNKSYDKNDLEAPVISVEETSGATKMSMKDDMRLCNVYLSKLDISADLAEPGIFNQCSGLIGLDQSIFVDVDDNKVLYMEEAVEAEVAAPLKVPSYTLLSSPDDSIFQKAMSQYKKLKVNATAEDGKKLDQTIIPSSDEEDRKVEEDQTDPSKMNDMQAVEDASIDIVVFPRDSLQRVEGYKETSQEKIDAPVVASVKENSEVLEEHVSMETSPVCDQGLLESEIGNEKPLSVESIERSDAPLVPEAKDSPMESSGSGDGLKLIDTKCGPLLNSDVSSEVEAMMPGSIVSASVNLSRIHHSPESTH